MASLREKARTLAGRLLILLVVIAAAVSGYWFGGGRSMPETAHTDAHPAHDAASESDTVWTCSMHPQVRRPEPGQCPICGMDLIPLVDDVDAAEPRSPRTFVTTEASRALMKIETTPVLRRYAEAPVRMVGKVAYDETQLGYITAWVPGRIERLYADYTGVEVKLGDHMVDLYSPELLAAKEELKRARESLNRMPEGAPAILRETAGTTLVAARERLGRWGLTKAQLEQAEAGGTASDNITIYAPMGGTVIERTGQEGMYVETGTRIYTLADITKMWVLLDAYELDLPWLKYGERVTFTLEAYPGETFDGRVAFIDTFVNPQTRTVKVRLNVDNPDKRLKADMFVRAVAHPHIARDGKVMDPALAGKWISPMHPEIVKDGPGKCDICGMPLVPAEELGYVNTDANDALRPLVIPVSAALVTGTRAVVYVEVPDAERPTYEGREIVLGPRAGAHYIVRSGLEEGERVVTSGNFKIDSALQIQAKPSMMTPDGGMPDDEAAPHSAAVKEALGELWRARDAFVASKEADEAAGVQEALESLRDAVANVDTALLPPAHVASWIEYSRRLTNDAVEGLYAEDDDALARVRDSMDHNLAMLAKRLGYSVEDAAPAPVMDVPEEFRLALGALYETYLPVQTGLAADDVPSAQSAAKSMLEALEQTSAGDLKAHWQKQQDTMQTALDTIAGASDLAAQREAFEALSMALLASIRHFGATTEVGIYRVHCPMAFDFKGADWLQVDETIANPYFGEDMYSCGTIVGEIETKRDSPDSHQHSSATKPTVSSPFEGGSRGMFSGLPRHPTLTKGPTSPALWAPPSKGDEDSERFDVQHEEFIHA